MWEYQKSPQHQAAIDKLKSDNDRQVARVSAATLKARREQSAKKALSDYELDQRATRAKTQRLRAERLARIAAAAEPVKAMKSLKKSPRRININ
jgi:hypothetical protein